MIRKTIKVSDNNFRKFDDPLGNETPRKYIFYAKTCDVPEGIPMSTNPRDQKLNCTPHVRQYDILSNKWGVLLCQKEYQTNDIRRSSREWL